MVLGFPSSEGAGKDRPNILNVPQPTKEKGQRSLKAEDIFFTKFVAPWARPDALSATLWRRWVHLQPIAMDCREILISTIQGFDWSITARDSDQRDELRGQVKHYTSLLDKGGNYCDFGYMQLMAWILSDYLDIPFGGAAEIGRKNDAPNGRVMWIKPLDGATLYPTLNKHNPVVQYYNTVKVAIFPKHALSRIFMSPRTEILREGWGMAPPEKVYFAFEMLNRGDKYYADLLLDTPPAGILDLADMEKDTALEWVESFRTFLAGTPSSFSIPVLYEHTEDVKFIPFGQVPNDIMYDRITLKYAAILAASYGLSLGDIGLQATSSGGETLAGSIRQERRTRRTGIAGAKKAWKQFVENFLPPTLQFNIIDPDDEVNVGQSRARLASATAHEKWVKLGVFSRQEIREQTLADGMFTINLPEEIPEDAKQELSNASGGNISLIGSPESAASGGHGNVRVSLTVDKSKHFESHLKRLITDAVTSIGPLIETLRDSVSEDEIYLTNSMIDESIFGEYNEDDEVGISDALNDLWRDKNWLRLSYPDNLNNEFEQLAINHVSKYLEDKAVHEYEIGFSNEIDGWKDNFEDAKENLKSIDWDRFSSSFKNGMIRKTKEFLGKSIAFLLKDILITEAGVDNDSIVNYDKVVETINKVLYSKFDEYVLSCTSLEIEKMLDKIRKEVIENE